MQKSRRLKVCAVVAVSMGLLAACSSSANSSKNSPTPSANTAVSGSAAGSQLVAKAEAFLAPYENNQPTIDVTPLKERPPSGKTISFLTCPIGSCQSALTGTQAAAKAIGWNVKVYNGGLTPASIVSAWNSIVQNPGDAVIAIGILPNEAVASQLAALAAKGIPVVMDASPSPVGGGVIADASPPAELELSAKIEAAWVTADSNATAKIAYFTDPSVPTLQTPETGFTDGIKELCPTCSVSIQSSNQTTGIGTTIPTQVVSYIQRNPDVQYVVFPAGDFTTGVSQALAAAGLRKVKIVTRESQPANVESIASGGEAMAVVAESYESGWLMVDTLIRHFEGMSFDATPIGNLHTITSANVPADPSKPYTVPGYELDYTRAWKLN